MTLLSGTYDNDETFKDFLRGCRNIGGLYLPIKVRLIKLPEHSDDEWIEPGMIALISGVDLDIDDMVKVYMTFAVEDSRHNKMLLKKVFNNPDSNRKMLTAEEYHKFDLSKQDMYEFLLYDAGEIVSDHFNRI